MEEQAHEQPLRFGRLVLDDDLRVDGIAQASGRHAEPRGDGRESLLEATPRQPQVVDDGATAVLVQRSEARGQRQRVASECTGNEDLLELAHELSATNHRGQRKPVRHSLAEDRQVGNNAEVLLAAPDRPAEAAHDLVEDQERPVPMRCGFHAGQKARGRRVDKHRLHDDCGHAPAVLVERRLQGVEVVVRERDHQPGEVLWNSL